jgi:serine/threonine-protein kinase
MDLVGRTLAHYRIVQRLGAGGMGEVYLAEDERLGRNVAIKVLLPQALGDEQARRRLLREARTAAALDHPGVCPVHEVGEAEGHTFVVMAYLEGEVLSRRIERGPLPVAEALDLALQVADALADAHAHGIVHRDVKPHNVIVSPRGHARLLDFGLARQEAPLGDRDGASEHSTDSRLTMPGAVIGTLSYMSPEQLRGLPLDAATDVFSLGVMLHEMLTARRPFEGQTRADTVSAILGAPPPPLSGSVSDLPRDLDRVLARVLAKDRAQRPSARELHAVFRALIEGRAPTSPGARTPTAAMPAAAVPVAPAPALPSAIAVLPFVDLSEERDQQYLCDGIAEEVISALTRVRGLRVAARSSAFRFRGADVDIREVGAQLNVGAVLEASVRRAGSRLRVTARLNDVGDGFTLWSERYDREVKDVFDIQDDIAGSIVDALRSRLSASVEAPRVRRFNDNVEAHQLYLKGLFHWNQRTPEALRAAIDHFQQAIALEPLHAAAWVGLANCYIFPAYYGAAPPANVIPLGRAAAEKALELEPALAEAHASLGMIAAIHDYRWDEAERHLRRAIELDAASSTAPMWLGLFALTPMGRLDEGLRMAEIARSLDPLNASTHATVGAVLYYRREPTAALGHLDRTIELQPRFPVAHFYRGRTLIGAGDFESAATSLETARTLLGDSPAVKGTLARCHAQAGDRDQATRLVGEMQALGGRRYVPSQALAEAHLGLGDTAAALDWLEKAVEERSALVVWLGVDAIYDGLRSEPRFTALLSRIGLGPEGSERSA